MVQEYNSDTMTTFQSHQIVLFSQKNETSQTDP